MEVLILGLGWPVTLLAVAWACTRLTSQRDTGDDGRWLTERVLEQHERERELWARERQMLLNRIKPETAQIIALDTHAHTPPAVAFDDDEAYWESRGVSREALADALAEAELAQRGTA
jgi:hypothetical protein